MFFVLLYNSMREERNDVRQQRGRSRGALTLYFPHGGPILDSNLYVFCLCRIKKFPLALTKAFFPCVSRWSLPWWKGRIESFKAK